MRKTVLYLLALTSLLTAPAWAATVGYTDQSSWSTAVGGGIQLIDFESYVVGTHIDDQLPGISGVVGESPNGAAQPTIDSSTNLPFPMFEGGTLPTEPQFLSNGMSAAEGYSTGSIRFDFSQGVASIGAFIVDGSPLANFSIELFDENQNITGSYISPPRNLTSSTGFIGITSDSLFYSARFASLSSNDSWGIDNLQYSVVPIPAAAWLFGSALAGLGWLRRKQSI
jgi:hypothetical protein